MDVYQTRKLKFPDFSRFTRLDFNIVRLVAYKQYATASFIILNKLLYQKIKMQKQNITTKLIF